VTICRIRSRERRSSRAIFLIGKSRAHHPHDPNLPLLALAGVIGRLRVQGLTTVRRKRIYDILRIPSIRNRNVTESTLASAEQEERITELR
jgi:hypothetical protein